MASHRLSRRINSDTDRDNSDSGAGSISERTRPRPIDLDHIFSARDLKDQLENPLAVRDALRAKQTDIERLKLEVGRLRDENFRLRNEFHDLERGFHEICDSENTFKLQTTKLSQENHKLTAEKDRLARECDGLKSRLADLAEATGVHAPVTLKTSRPPHPKPSENSEKPSKDRQRDRLSRRFEISRTGKEPTVSRKSKPTPSSNLADTYIEVKNDNILREPSYPSYITTPQLDSPIYAPPLSTPTFATISRGATTSPNLGRQSPTSRRVTFARESGSYYPHDRPSLHVHRKR